jgi:iron-sulfur cluster insertion protein
MQTDHESSVVDTPIPLLFTDAAAAKVKTLIDEEGNPDLKLRVFVQGGGCSGFQYGFTFDETANDDDTAMEKNGVTLLIDSMSYQYLVGAEIDYKEDLEGSQFVIKNPNAKRVALERLPLVRKVPRLKKLPQAEFPTQLEKKRLLARVIRILQSRLELQHREKFLRTALQPKGC